MSDITMSLDDTLELDTIIKESSVPLNPVTHVKYEGSESTVHNSTGIQTNTYIFEPEKSGNYTITVNGQDISVKVTDPSTAPDSQVSQYHYNEGSGSSIANEYSGQPDASLGNSNFWTSNSNLIGDFGIDFSGGSENVALNSKHSFIGKDKDWSFAITIKAPNLSIDQNIYEFGVSGGVGFTVGTPTGKSGELSATHWGTGVASSTTTATTGSLIRVGASFEGTARSGDLKNEDIKISINGNFAGDGSNTTRSPNGDGETLGSGVGEAFPSDVLIDNPTWYDTVLSESEFNNDYQNQPWS